jgi:uncharacterized ion transporter superfamily protein YfcC
MNALFFLMGLLAGLAGGLGVAGTAQAFVKGFELMAFRLTYWFCPGHICGVAARA